ncbi:hypothetical protein M0R45_034493 [Rubus argutus]|uniref:Uncharacterized protein n=1 Tax=Rubus argutus TaxID=59490 RepID=A0AAW1VS29_RUBAR
MATCFIRAVVRRWCLNPKGLGSNPSGSKIVFSHLISAAGPKKRIIGLGPHRPAGSGMWAWSSSVRLTGVDWSQVGSAVWPSGPGSSGPVAWWLCAPVASGLHRLLFI